ncbi:phasin family protein [Roseateles sp. BYS180W]|uniref:Phasin family protein n=1 Tax=Roseateles rivi TaxID=3299028 RepID=A0ABW7FW15_9BURK
MLSKSPLLFLACTGALLPLFVLHEFNMAKKSQRSPVSSASASATATEVPNDKALAQAVRASAQQIWAAGLGAFAKAQGEGCKTFEHLVQEGLKLQKKTQTVAELKLSEVSQRVGKTVSTTVSQKAQQATQQWDKLEAIFEDRVARALGRLGVPSSHDLCTLIARLDALSEALNLTKKAAVPRKTSARKTTRKGNGSDSVPVLP